LDDLSESHVPRIVLTGSAIAVRGLFERYDVYEVFVKGAAFNRAQFLQTVKAAKRATIVQFECPHQSHADGYIIASRCSP
jgi:hypothetical protein